MTASNPTKNVVVDASVIENIRSLGDGDPAFLNEVLEAYINGAISLIAEIKQAVPSLDWEKLNRSAHTLKGSSLNVGAQALAEIGLDLEHMARNKSIKGLTEKVQDLEIVWKETQVGISHYLQRSE